MARWARSSGRAAALGAYQLVGEHEHRFEAELPVAEVEQVLQAGAQQVDDHDVVVALDAVVPDVGDAHCAEARQCMSTRRWASLARNGPAAALTSALQDLVELGLIHQLRVLGLDALLQGDRGGSADA
jgi:hypothetical protein